MNDYDEAIARGYIPCDCAHALCLGYRWPKGREEIAQRGAAFRARKRGEKRAAKTKA